MKTYELTYIISPNSTLEEATSTAREIEASIQGAEGVIVKQENPVAKPLAYQIKGRASGFVGSIEFQIEEEKLAVVQEKVQGDKKIVRQMLTIKEMRKAKKQRRDRIAEEKSAPKEADKPAETAPAQNPVESKEEKPKVELKDIEQKLDEILGQ